MQPRFETPDLKRYSLSSSEVQNTNLIVDDYRHPNSQRCTGTVSQEPVDVLDSTRRATRYRVLVIED